MAKDGSDRAYAEHKSVLVLLMLQRIFFWWGGLVCGFGKGWSE